MRGNATHAVLPGKCFRGIVRVAPEMSAAVLEWMRGLTGDQAPDFAELTAMLIEKPAVRASFMQCAAENRA